MKKKLLFSILVLLFLLGNIFIQNVFGQENHKTYLSFQIFQDTTNSKWIATEKGALLIKSDGKIELFDQSKGLNDDFVFKIVIGKDGSVWFIHSGRYWSGFSTEFNAMGVSHLKKDGSIEIFDGKKGLPSGMVTAIAFDIDGSVWFGTNIGLAHLSNDGKIQIINEEKGLPSSNIMDIYIDKDGIRWVATSKGLSRIDKLGRITSVVFPN